MKTARWMMAILAFAPALAAGQTLAELEQQVRENPTSLDAKVALAEGYLHACELDKSLAVWREVLAADPDHARARTVVERLSAQVLDLDRHLDVLAALIDRGVVDGIESMLDTAAKRAAGDEQKARILYLRGQAALKRQAAAEARAAFETARRAYGDTHFGGRSALAIVRMVIGPVEEAQRELTSPRVADLPLARSAEVERLLRGVLDSTKLDNEVKDEARFLQAMYGSADGPGGPAHATAAALRKLVPTLESPLIRREALRTLALVLRRGGAPWTADAVRAAAGVLTAEPTFDEAMRTLDELLDVARTSESAAVLDAMIAAIEAGKPADPAAAREAAFVRVEALLQRAVVEYDPEAMLRFVAGARAGLDALKPQAEAYHDEQRLHGLAGRTLLVEGQKRVALQGSADALPVLMRAREHYLMSIESGPTVGTAHLMRIARLLEHVDEWPTAVELYRDLAEQFPEREAGRDALWRAARLTDRPLGNPVGAIDLYAQYASRYPAELPYRQLSVGRRLRRLGYANLLDFQKRSDLSPDGVFGPKTQAKLEELEQSFGQIALRDGEPDILRGRFVHPSIFAIAKRLDAGGRHDEALRAYRMFVDLFPTKKDADDALLAVARLFRANLMFDEAIGAYRELMEDFPKGDKTSEAYVEAAGCLENLGRWGDAKELYELYAKKFPRYKHVGLCRQRIALMEDIQQYEGFVESNPDSPKLAEARYQIASILYKELKNNTKAAVQFTQVARLHPKHVRAPDALYTAGTAHLREENFPAARAVYAELVAKYPESRLADDGQYWIGHTYEYAARALGRLGNAGIVLKRRSLTARAALLADLALRRQYNPDAKPGTRVPEEVWGGDTLGVLASGSKRDRVNADLFRAIDAYRKVVERFKMGDMAGQALLRVGTIYTEFLGDPEKGIEAYQELLAHYPGAREAVDALYEVGRYHLKSEKYDDAVKSFQQFIFNYPQEAKVEEAMLAIARCRVEQKQWDKALDAYKSYLNKFPRGRYARFAKAQVEWIRMYHF